ncbi:MAG: DUF1552 domain-containing protein, partial [Planctomycetia bacterium]
EPRPQPEASAAAPTDVTGRASFCAGFEAMLTMARLAIQSDSTRLVTLMVDAFATPAFRLDDSEITTDGYHNLSHHGQSAEKLRQLEEADRRQMALLGGLFTALAERREGDRRLLDDTVVLYGSNMGDANTHDNTNLPAERGRSSFLSVAFRRVPLCGYERPRAVVPSSLTIRRSSRRRAARSGCATGAPRPPAP